MGMMKLVMILCEKENGPTPQENWDNIATFHYTLTITKRKT
jgi:hypothetical protein